MKNYYDIKESIYLIENIKNNNIYIGQTTNLVLRIIGHYKDLNKGKHNKKFQKDYDKYGVNLFKFKALELINPDRIESKKLVSIYLHHRENYYIDKFNSIESGYNTIKANKIDYSKIDVNRNDYFKPVKFEFINMGDLIKLELDLDELTNLYLICNPQFNKGLSFKIKARQIISNYIIKHGMSYNDVEHCIESNKMFHGPVWELFYKYWYKEGNVNKNKNNNIEEKKSQYKNSASNSTNIDDWL